MSVQFKHADDHAEIGALLRLIERLETLAYQAELGFWDMARAEFWAHGYVSHHPRGIADSICSGAEHICNDILKRMARLLDTNYTAVDWSSNTNALYIGSKDLELEVTAPTSSVQVGSTVQTTGGIEGVSVTAAVSGDDEDTGERRPRVATVKAVANGLREKVTWLQHWTWNADSANLREAYRDTYSSVNDWVGHLLGSIGPHFATPLTTFYSLVAVGKSEYDRPRVGAYWDTSNVLRLTSIVKYSEDGVCPQGAAAGFHLLGAGDWVHLVRLDCQGYDHFADRVYQVNAIDSGYVELTAPSDIQLPLVRSLVAEELGEHFLLRKIQGA